MANSSRPGNGISRRSSSARRPSRDSRTLIAMLDLDDRARTEPHKQFRRIFQPDTYWETLRNPHPIQRSLHVRHRTREIDALIVQHPPSDTFDDALDRLATIDHRKDGRAIPNYDGMQIGFPKVGDGEPLFRADQSEQCLRRNNHLAR